MSANGKVNRLLNEAKNLIKNGHNNEAAGLLYTAADLLYEMEDHNEHKPTKDERKE